MPSGGKLKLNLTGVSGSAVREAVDVELRHLTHGTTLRARVPAGKSAIISDLESQPNGVYRVTIDPPSYLPVAQFVAIKPSGITKLDCVFPADARKVKSVEWPAYEDLPAEARTALEASDTVLLFEGKVGIELYDAIDDVRRAGLLNIIAKMRNATFASGRSVLSYLVKLLELRGDRFFAVVPQELREETKNATADGLFTPVSSALHHPPPDFDHAGSFKTLDDYGNLQLTFFARGDEWRADIDIDDAGGLGHVFQVVRNTLTGRPTHPYDIHELLLHHQKVDPGYVLVV
jgi:hypothetical protein